MQQVKHEKQTFRPKRGRCKECGQREREILTLKQDVHQRTYKYILQIIFVIKYASLKYAKEKKVLAERRGDYINVIHV